MKIRWVEGKERLSPRDVVRRLLNNKLESLYCWEELWEQVAKENGERPLTKKQADAVHRQVDRVARSIRKRYRVSHIVGCEETGVSSPSAARR